MASGKNRRPYRVPAIRDLRADTPSGHCLFCQEPFVEGRRATGQGDSPKEVCGAAERERDEAKGMENECQRAYHRLLVSRVREVERDGLNVTDFRKARKLLERAADLNLQAAVLLARVERRRSRTQPVQER